MVQPALFDGVDPPRALKPQESLVPKEPSSASVPSMTGAMPEVTQTPAPAQPISDNQPQRTQTPASLIIDPNAPNTPDPFNDSSGLGSTPIPASPVQTDDFDAPVNTYSDPTPPLSKIFSPADGLSLAPTATNLESDSPGLGQPAVYPSVANPDSYAPSRLLPSPGNTVPIPTPNPSGPVFPIFESSEEASPENDPSDFSPSQGGRPKSLLDSDPSSDHDANNLQQDPSRTSPVNKGALGENSANDPSAAISPVLVGGQPIAKAADGGVIVGDTTIAPSAQATVQGHTVSLNPVNVVVDGSTYAIPSSEGAAVQMPPQSGAAVLVGGQSLAKAANGGILIGGSITLNPSAQTTVNGHVISAGPSSINVDGGIYALPSGVGEVVQTPQQENTPVLVDGQPITRGGDGGLIIGGTTIPAGTQTTVSGQLISAGASNVNVNGDIYALPSSVGEVVQTPQEGTAPVLLAGQPVVKAADGGLIIGENSIPPGTRTTVNGQLVSAGASNVNIGGNIYALPPSVGGVVQEQQGGNAPVLVDGQPIIKGADGGVIIEANSIPSGTQTTVNGHVISAGPSQVDIDGSIYTIPTDVGDVVQIQEHYSPDIPVEIDGQPVLKAGDGGVVIQGTTVAPGIQTTIHGHTVSVGPSNVGIDGSIYVLPTNVGGAVETPSTQDQGVPLDIDGQSIVKASNGGAIIAGSVSLAPGQQATISGHVFSAGATNVVVDGSSYAMPTSASGSLPSLKEQQGATSVMFDGQPLLKAADGGVIMDGDTIIPPGTQTTVHGHVISAGASDVVIDGSSIQILPTNVGGTLQAVPPGMFPTPAPLLIGGQPLVKAQSGRLIVGGSITLTPGAQATVQGHIISEGASDVVIDGSSTYELPSSVGGTVIGVSGAGPLSSLQTNTKIPATTTTNSNANPSQILTGAAMENLISSTPQTLIESLSTHGTLAFITTVILTPGNPTDGALSAEKKKSNGSPPPCFVGWETVMIMIMTLIVPIAF